jgi:MFS transporter, MHS family, shikimate and dehydroshikimate transport protein
MARIIGAHGTEAVALPTSIIKVAFASFIGTTIEWYDFFLYGTAAALVFNRLFFPNFDPLMGTLAAFGTYAVGFVARPVGGIVFGHFGDKIGRKTMLFLTLIIMGLASFLIGVLPTYQSVGVIAPILLLLLRILQGFGVGGEWGGAVLMAVEHAPPGRRGFYGSWPQLGVPAGLVLGNLVFSIFSGQPEDQFLAWGWRVPFLLSLVLVAVGIFIRLQVSEPPGFAKVKATHSQSKMPVLDAIRQHPREILVAMGARFAENGIFYIYTVFVLVYATQQLKVPQSTILTGVLIAAVFELFAMPTFGALSDRVGRRPVYMFGAAWSALFAFPFFLLVDTRQTVLIWLAVIGLALGHSAMYGPQASFFSELFGTRVRYSGASLGYQLSSVFAGGLSPLIATALLATYLSFVPIALYMVAMAVLTLVSVYAATETVRRDIHIEADRPGGLQPAPARPDYVPVR